jgi:hypothetical protein
MSETRRGANAAKSQGEVGFQTVEHAESTSLSLSGSAPTPGDEHIQSALLKWAPTDEPTQENLDIAFGPQSDQVTELTHAIASLDDTDIQRLDALIGAPGSDSRGLYIWKNQNASNAGDDAASAAGDISANGSAEAAWSAATSVTTGSTRAWGKDVAIALSRRHLIGDTYLQEHYDDATKVWRVAVGPIHPDDKAMPRIGRR